MGMFEFEKNVEKLESFNGLDEKIENAKEEKREEIRKDQSEARDVDLVFLLDKSGSMYNVVSDTIGGFNSFIEREREKNPRTLVTLVLFDTEYNVLYTRKPINEVGELTRNEYYADGCTALLDAIGTTINRLDRTVDNEVLFVITTDGLENSSREYSKADIKNMIANHSWEFLFIGADIDAYEEAGSLGIDSNHTAKYRKSSAGLGALFDSVSDAHEEVTRGGTISGMRWKRRLD